MSSLVTIPEKWLTSAQFLAEFDPISVSPLLRVLLTSDGSTTTSLAALHVGPIEVEILSQGEEPLDANTADDLGVADGVPALIRKVWLRHANRRVLFAASALPLATLSPRLTDDVRRGAEPLGRLLDGYNRPTIREGLRISRLQNATVAEGLGAAPSEWLWCRTYRLIVEDLLTASIFEVFTPRIAD